MKRALLAVCLCLALLLSGCGGLSGVLVVPPSPDASIGDPVISRPAASEVSYPERDPNNLYFVPSEDGRISQVISPDDVLLVDLFYGDETYFALLIRSGVMYLRLFDKNGAYETGGEPAGKVADWQLLGFADGNVCLYSPTLQRTFACDARGKYVWFPRGRADEVRLVKDGYLFFDGQRVTLYPPTEKQALAEYTLPQGAELLFADRERAICKSRGELFVLLPGGTELPCAEAETPFDGGCIRRYAEIDTVFTGNRAFVLPDGGSAGDVIVCGQDHLLLSRENGYCFLSLSDGTADVFTPGEGFVFRGRTEDGFVFREQDSWYRFTCTGTGGIIPAILSYAQEDRPQTVAGELLCASSRALCSVELVCDFTETDAGGYRITPADGDTVAEAAAEAITLLKRQQLTDETRPLYLCASVQERDEDRPYAILPDKLLWNCTADTLQALLAERNGNTE